MTPLEGQIYLRKIECKKIIYHRYLWSSCWSQHDWFFFLLLSLSSCQRSPDFPDTLPSATCFIFFIAHTNQNNLIHLFSALITIPSKEKTKQKTLFKKKTFIIQNEPEIIGNSNIFGVIKASVPCSTHSPAAQIKLVAIGQHYHQ